MKRRFQSPTEFGCAPYALAICPGFRVHGAKADGFVAYRLKLSRGRPLGFFAAQPGCTVAM